MANAGHDQNHVATLSALSSANDGTIVPLWADPTSHRLLVDSAGGGTGTVTSVSVVTANGFSASVATPTTTPAITLTTTVTGIIKGNGTALSAATAGVDYTALAFKTVSVSGQSDVVADSAADTMTFVGAGTITITTDAATDTITFTGSGGASGLTVGTTTITSGTSGRVLYDNGGVLGELVTTGSNNVVLSTSPTITTAVLNGTVSGTSVATASTASTLLLRDASGNSTENNIVFGYATTATSAGTLTLTVTSAREQFFTGVTTHTVVLPDCTTLALGFQYRIHNNSTGLVTVQKSGGATLWILGANSEAFLTCTDISTAAGVWDVQYLATGIATGKKLSFANSLLFSGTDGEQLTLTKGLTVTTNAGTLAYGAASKTLTINNSLTLAGTDGETLTLTKGLTVTTNAGTIAFGAASKTLTINKSLTLDGTDSTTMTFPTTSATIARTDAAQTFTGIQTFGGIVYQSGTTVTMTVPTVDNTVTGPVTNAFNSGYSSTAVGDLVYLDSAGTWQKASAAGTTMDAYQNMLGIALEIKASGSPVNVALKGSFVYISAFTTLSLGKPAYMSTTAGAIQVAQPSATSTVIRVVGFGCNTSKMLYFNPSDDYIVHA